MGWWWWVSHTKERKRAATPIGAFLTKRTVGGKEKPTHRPFDERPQRKRARTMGKAKKKSSPRTKLGEISNFVNIGDTTKPFGG